MVGPLNGVMTILALGLLTQGLLVATADARGIAVISAESDSVEMVEVEQYLEMDSGSRDSLMVEIRRYSRMIADMRDSLAQGDGEIELSDNQRQLIEENIEEISEVIEEIGVELSNLEFEIKDNTISLVNEAGEGIIINIPENLDEHLSEGLEILSRIILSELPDSIDFDSGHGWDWSGFAPHAPPKPRKIIHGNIIKIWDDLYVSEKEDVRGDVVVVFGNGEISGRVDGTVVVVFGNLLLDETAEVTGEVVSVGGRLDKDPNAKACDVVAVDLWPRGLDGGLAGILGQGILPFLMCQGTFLLTILLAVIGVVAVPRVRFEAITETLRQNVGPSLGLGLVVAIVGQMAVLVLVAVLVLTVIGVPLALLVFLAMIIVIILSVAVCGASFGARVCAMLGTTCSSPWLTVVVGMSALHLVSFLGSVLSLSSGMAGFANVLVVLGVIIKTVAFFLGLGALAISRFGARQPS
ncbi:MAG: hypothetical protein KAH56_05315 [Candidatus Krumholzibacteria bacterium]|nr:hypothetical protein [Candidatus Krumholzibacteria bacterium]